VHPTAAKMVRLIDKNVEAAEGRKKGRTHLGASMLGKKCARAVWYGWRWAHVTRHQGRLLRLFNRGHREEPDLVKHLEGLGLIIRSHAQRLCYHDGSDSYVSYDWDAEFPPDVDDVSGEAVHIERATARGEGPQQITFSDLDDHFGGSCDGMLHGMDLVDPTWELKGPGLAEYKTHGEKSFVDVAGKLEDYRKHLVNPAKHPFTGKGVVSSKIEHYIQMQVYMKYFGLEWALYVAICKNTDDIYMEVVQYKPEVAEAYKDRAAAIIKAQTPPARITNDPAWWECKFCDFREVCHHGKLPQKNCRSCVEARPVEGGQWVCDKYHQLIPKDFAPLGCDNWTPIAT
jgi:hypothetical protein